MDLGRTDEKSRLVVSDLNVYFFFFFTASQYAHYVMDRASPNLIIGMNIFEQSSFHLMRCDYCSLLRNNGTNDERSVVLQCNNDYFIENMKRCFCPSDSMSGSTFRGHENIVHVS